MHTFLYPQDMYIDRVMFAAFSENLMGFVTGRPLEVRVFWLRNVCQSFAETDDNGLFPRRITT